MRFVGAWELTAGLLAGVVIFSENHYSISRMDHQRKLFQADEPTQVEAAEAYGAFHGWAGTYAVLDSTLTLKRDIAKNPNNVGRDRTFRFTIQGDKMTWIGINQEAELFWQKLS